MCKLGAGGRRLSTVWHVPWQLNAPLPPPSCRRCWAQNQYDRPAFEEITRELRCALPRCAARMPPLRVDMQRSDVAALLSRPLGLSLPAGPCWTAPPDRPVSWKLGRPAQSAAASCLRASEALHIFTETSLVPSAPLPTSCLGT